MRRRMGTADAMQIGRSIGTDFSLDNELGNISERQTRLLDEIRQDFIRQFDSEENDYGLGGYESCDFGWLNDKVFVVGLEPSYQWDNFLVFQFDFENKGTSAVLRGTAFGSYGSNTAIKMKYLKDYKRKTKYYRFIEKWYERIKEEWK